MIRCLIVDDEPLARECITGYVDQIDFMERVATARNPVELTNLLEIHPVDLLFLDIQMPLMTGLEYLKTAPHPPLVVITTAFPSYALEGFELNVVDYLLKPITFDRFLKAAHKARDYHRLLEASPPPSPVAAEEKNFIFIKCDHRYERIFLDQILYVESVQNYVTFHTAKGAFMTLMTLKSAEENLPAEQFIRVHKSFIVSKAKVEAVENHQLIVGGTPVPVSRNYRKSVIDELVIQNLWNSTK